MVWHVIMDELCHVLVEAANERLLRRPWPVCSIAAVTSRENYTGSRTTRAWLGAIDVSVRCSVIAHSLDRTVVIQDDDISAPAKIFEEANCGDPVDADHNGVRIDIPTSLGASQDVTRPDERTTLQAQSLETWVQCRDVQHGP